MPIPAKTDENDSKSIQIIDDALDVLIKANDPLWSRNFYDDCIQIEPFNDYDEFTAIIKRLIELRNKISKNS